MAERYIGLCMAAGGVKTGVDIVLGEVRSHRAKFVLLASDASDRTKKQVTDKCTYYNVKVFSGGYTGDDIAHLLGKRSSCAAVAFVGKGPWESAEKALRMRQTDAADVLTAMTQDRKDDI